MKYAKSPLSVLITALLVSGATGAGAAPLDLTPLRGRVIYLDFWASWCAPCRRSFPWMQAMQQAHESEGLTIIAINVDQDRADAERFLAQFQPGFAIRYDPRGEAPEHYQVRGMPTSLLIDRRGVIRYRDEGFQADAPAAYEAQLRQLLAEPQPTDGVGKSAANLEIKERP